MRPAPDDISMRPPRGSRRCPVSAVSALPASCRSTSEVRARRSRSRAISRPPVRTWRSTSTACRRATSTRWACGLPTAVCSTAATSAARRSPRSSTRRWRARYWNGARAVGRQFRDGPDAPLTVVGVVPDVKYRMLREDAGPSFYLAAAQAAPRPGAFHVRTAGPPAALLDTLRRALGRGRSRGADDARAHAARAGEPQRQRRTARDDDRDRSGGRGAAVGRGRPLRRRCRMRSRNARARSASASRSARRRATSGASSSGRASMLALAGSLAGAGLGLLLARADSDAPVRRRPGRRGQPRRSRWRCWRAWRCSRAGCPRGVRRESTRSWRCAASDDAAITWRAPPSASGRLVPSTALSWTACHAQRRHLCSAPRHPIDHPEVRVCRIRRRSTASKLNDPASLLVHSPEADRPGRRQRRRRAVAGRRPPSPPTIRSPSGPPRWRTWSPRRRSSVQRRGGGEVRRRAVSGVQILSGLAPMPSIRRAALYRSDGAVLTTYARRDEVAIFTPPASPARPGGVRRSAAGLSSGLARSASPSARSTSSPI